MGFNCRGGNRGGSDGFGFAARLAVWPVLVCRLLKESAARRTGGFGRLPVERPVVFAR